MTKAQQTLKEDIEKINDDTTIEKVRIFIMGILAQQSISENVTLRSNSYNHTRKER